MLDPFNIYKYEKGHLSDVANLLPEWGAGKDTWSRRKTFSSP